MNNIQSVKREIEGIIRILIESNMSVNQNYPVIISNGLQKKIEWSPMTNLSISLKNLDYDIIYSEVDKNRDYTMKLIDGNLIQMLYTFENDELVSHRLAMFPSPKLELFQEQPDIYENDELYGDIIERRIVPFPIRFDYNKDEIVSNKNHPKSHVTLGQYTDCRIPAYGPISPTIFMDFILENFYNTYYISSYLSSKINPKCANVQTITEEEQRKLHFNLV
ncbi:MAG: DUF2290 domain-containing protein [Eubacteriales bacterium]